MTQEEKLYWTGNAVFVTAGGAGLYVVFDHWFWGTVFIAIGLAGLAFSFWEGRSVAKSTILFSLVLLTWGLVAYDYYDRHSGKEIPEFDEPPVGQFQRGYGFNNGDCYVKANGDAFLGYRGSYRIAMACAWDDAKTDRLDTRLQVSNEFEIVSGDIMMRTTVSPNFIQLLPRGTNFLILLIPYNVSIAQLTTPRIARALGVKIKFAGSTGPMY